MRIYFLLILFYVGCNQNISDKRSIYKGDNTSEVSTQKIENQTTRNLTCEEFIRKIIESSELDLHVYGDNIKYRIDKNDKDKIRIQLFFENNTSDKSNQQINESTIAWLELHKKTKKLYDITFDPENPKEIIFEDDLKKSIDLLDVCSPSGFTNDKLSENYLDKNKAFKNIFNKKLIGLLDLNKKATNPYKKYGLDGSIECFCNSEDFFIDQKNKKIYFFNHCNTNEFKSDLVFDITNIHLNNNQLTITTYSDLKLKIKSISENLFEIDFIFNDSLEKIKPLIKRFYTQNPEKYLQFDCGDFDG